MKLYDEENLSMDDEEEDFAGYTMIEENSIFRATAAPLEEETIATPIPENESTVILSSPQTAGLREGKELALSFEGEECSVYFGKRKVGSLKSAFVKKLKAERGGQCARVYYKDDVPPMVRLVFGEGEPIPTAESAAEEA